MFPGARHWLWQKPARRIFLAPVLGPWHSSHVSKPLEGLMHLPLSCCEKAGTEKSLCGLGGVCVLGAGRLKLLWKMSKEWPVRHTWHLNEDQVLTRK